MANIGARISLQMLCDYDTETGHGPIQCGMQLGSKKYGLLGGGSAKEGTSITISKKTKIWFLVFV